MGIMLRGALTSNKASAFGGAVSVLYMVPRKVYSADAVFAVVNATFHTNVVEPKSLARGFLRTSTPPTFNLLLLLLHHLRSISFSSSSSSSARLYEPSS